MTQNDDPRQEAAKDAAGARPAREIVSKLSEHEKTVRDQELLLNAEKYFGGLSDEEKLLLGLNAPAVKDAEARPSVLKVDKSSSETSAAAPLSRSVEPRRREIGSPIAAEPANQTGVWVGSDWVWAGLTALIFIGVVGWVLVGR